VITQTVALLLDAYRDLNARKLFWITLVLSGVFIGSFGLLGADASGLKLLWFHWDMPEADYIYKQIFSWIVVGFWLTIVAAVLALVSTAGIFPDLISGGSIDLYLSKPISRLRLFLTKYVTGLLFVTLQVAVIVIGGMVLLGLRSGLWKLQFLWMIPIVVCFFSYLFAVCVLMGLLTRSTITALLLTVVCWSGFWGLHFVENRLFKDLEANNSLIGYYKDRIRWADGRIAELKSQAPANASELSYVLLARSSNQETLDAIQTSVNKWTPTYRELHIAETLVPKTTETTDLLDRFLFNDTEVTDADERHMSWLVRQSRNADLAAELEPVQHAQARADVALRHRSVAWIIGTSLIFEAAVLGVAAWIFCRRDY
jgi:hypothetical protein